MTKHATKVMVKPSYICDFAAGRLDPAAAFNIASFLRYDADLATAVEHAHNVRTRVHRRLTQADGAVHQAPTAPCSWPAVLSLFAGKAAPILHVSSPSRSG